MNLKFSFIHLLLLSACCSQKQVAVLPTEYQSKPRLMENIKRVHVTSCIMAPHLDAKEIESYFVAALNEIGTVHSDQACNHNLQEGDVTSACMTLMLGNTGETGRLFPVIGVSLNVEEGAELLANHAKALCSVWKKQQYLEENENAPQHIKHMLHTSLQQFLADFQKANPGHTPEFYLTLL